MTQPSVDGERPAPARHWRLETPTLGAVLLTFRSNAQNEREGSSGDSGAAANENEDNELPSPPEDDEKNTSQRQQRRAFSTPALHAIPLNILFSHSSGQIVARIPGPTGHMAMVFTDVEQSTQLWRDAPSAMQVALERHNRIMRTAALRYDGYVVKVLGDGFFIVFKRPLNAVRFALAAQASLHVAEYPPDILEHEAGCAVGEPPILRGLRVRIGINSGDPLVDVDERTGLYDFYGPAVNAASRIANYSRGGEILVSKGVVDDLQSETVVPSHGSPLSSSQVPGVDFSFFSAGFVNLRDLPLQELYSLCDRGLLMRRRAFLRESRRLSSDTQPSL